MFEIVGLAGIAISVAAYVPQIVHLGREHCSAGVSIRAWGMWLAGGLLIGAVAVHHREMVFIVLQVGTLTSAAVILFLARRYRGMVCESHGEGANLAAVKASPSTDPRLPRADADVLRRAA